MDSTAGSKDQGIKSRRLHMLGLRRVSSEQRAAPSCVLIQIDGLSYRHFRRAIQTGKLPFLAKLLKKRKFIAGPWHSMVPTSTPAFQAGLFYGTNDEIPAFFWYDKSKSREMHMNNSDDVAQVEEEIKQRAAPFPGLLAGGSSYSALFTGGATTTLLTFARLFSPRFNLTLKRRWLLIFILSQIQLIARVLYYATIEAVLAIYDLIRGLITHRKAYMEFKFVFPRIVAVVICREISTLAAILDIYRGAGPIYMNQFAYDEHAHHRGPDSRFAYWTLRGIDASIHRIWKAAEWARKHNVRDYDVYIWSDHGQTPAVPFEELFHELPERHFDMLFRAIYGPAPKPEEQTGPAKNLHNPRRPYEPVGHAAGLAPKVMDSKDKRVEFLTDMGSDWLRGKIFRFIRPALDFGNYLESLLPPPQERRLIFTSAGPLAFMNLVDSKEPMTFEDWSERFPFFLELVAQHKGIGFMLSRTREGGCRVGCEGKWFDLFDEAAVRANTPRLITQILISRRQEFCRWCNMKAAGDLFLFGQRDGDRPVISYSYELGSHGGPSPQETLPFILVPARAARLWPDVSLTRIEHLPTLKDLHQRLRQAYGPERVARPEPHLKTYSEPLSDKKPA